MRLRYFLNGTPPEWFLTCLLTELRALADCMSRRDSYLCFATVSGMAASMKRKALTATAESVRKATA